MKLNFLMPILALSALALTGCEKTSEPTLNPTDKTTTEDSAKPSEKKTTTSNKENETPTTSQPEPLMETKVYMVGDSTMCSFNDTTYYYPRYGYGTQLQSFLDSKAIVSNLALSGRSSKSFISEDNYETLTNNIKSGDYLIIGFGHNDEKEDDLDRYTKAIDNIDTALADETSFQYSLYNNYVKLALDKGAHPILATPIVRADTNNNYDGTSAHITSTGDYAKAIRDLGSKYSLPVIDLTSITKNDYITLGFDKAKKYHAVTSGESSDSGVTVTPNWSTVDKTHLNIYGAKKVAFEFASALKTSSSDLKKYVKSDIISPMEANDLVVSSSYHWTSYEPADWSNYEAKDQFKTLSEGYYGTAFGDTGGDPLSEGNGYVAKEDVKGTFIVGQSAGSSKGKIASSGIGMAFLFKQIDIKKNFTMTAKAKVTKTASTKQAGFGLALRDDCYLPTRDAGKSSNSIYAGFNTMSKEGAYINFSYENGALVNSKNTIDSYYALEDEAVFKITRLGQVITATTTYKNQTYTDTYTDFDISAKDHDYYYVGMWANRGTIVEFTDVEAEITGDSISA